MKNIIINIALFAVVAFLVYMVWDSINQPLAFAKEKEHREVEVIQRLKDIRTAQNAYRQMHNSYMGNFDTLIDFLKTGTIPVVKMIPDPTDTTFTKTINDTLGYVPVIDSIFRPGFNANTLRNVPFSQNAVFEMNAGFITRGGMKVSVFEAKVPYEVYLQGLDDQRVKNLIAEQEQIDKYPGLRVGSMEEPSTDGNWE
ncbi:MAG: hypothetical protein LBM67_01250 [Lentimicrobiaceae bacterium]|jgi:hypothetical protein|nr:hypothetical protein [Lentimicrobiaceae bacterium]